MIRRARIILGLVVVIVLAAISIVSLASRPLETTTTYNQPVRFGYFSVAGRQNSSYYSAFFSLADAQNNSVSSSGSVNFTIVDSRNRSLYSSSFQVNLLDFKHRTNTTTASSLLSYSWQIPSKNVSEGAPNSQGEGRALISFMQVGAGNNRPFADEFDSVAIPSLPRVSINSIAITKTGTYAAYLVVSSTQAPNSNLTFFAGDTILLNFTTYFQTAGDDGVVLTNASGTSVAISVANANFQLAGIDSSTSKGNPIYVPAQQLVHFSLTVKAPDQSFTGPLLVVLDSE